jgi:hypothetical protein
MLSQLFSHDVVPVVHDGTTDMADNEPKYRYEHVLNPGIHGDNHAIVGMVRRGSGA